jgi:TolB-like protein/tetratricopeptide (TPR) repeat protein
LGLAVAVALPVAALVLVRLWPTTSRQAAPPPIRSLAVLPFDNIMKDPAQDYFVEGVHEAVLTDLARLGGVRVISRTSVMRYRDAGKPVREVARELGVDAVVEGSVLRSGDRVRVTAQLVRGATDEHLWARSYDRDVRDVLALLSDVSGAIAGEIHETVAGGLRAASGSPSAPPSVRPEVYEAYLLGVHAARPLSRPGLEAALSLYRKATALDARFAPAWGGIAAVRVIQAVHGHVPAAEAVPEAREAARRALALDDRSASAYCALGWVALYYDWDLEAARRTMERAVALSPSDSSVRQAYADYLMLAGRREEGLEQGRIGRQYDPLWPTAHYLVLYHALSSRRYDEAIEEGRKMLEVFPETTIAHWPIGLALWLKGAHEEALAEWKGHTAGAEEMRGEWEARFGADAECLHRLEGGYRRGGPNAALVAIGDCTAAIAAKGDMNAIEPATWYAAAGRRELAFEWLGRSFARREPHLLFTVVNPLFDPVRSDPRFEAILRRVGIPTPPS